MDAPVFDFVHNYAQSGFVRAHMPGHKGKNVYNNVFDKLFPYDITEIKGADTLFDADGIIAQSELNASRLFGSATFYSASGSTSCIQIMLAAVCKTGGTILAARNSHKALINSCGLLGIDVEWIYPEGDCASSLVSFEITAQEVEKSIISLQKAQKPKCVFITSPDYLGKTADIKSISEVCHKHGIPLVVDAAHGAHLHFLDVPCDAMAQGADICCESAHKSLPVLTGGAYIHTRACFADAVKQMRGVFSSSSPSYLILQSLDLCNAYIDGNFKNDLQTAVIQLNNVKNAINGKFKVCDTEPLKLAVYTLSSGFTGYETADLLREKRIEPEYADNSHVLLMLSASSDKMDFERIESAFLSIDVKNNPITQEEFHFKRLKKALSPRDAMFLPQEKILAENCAGRICACTVTACPPCIPVAASGEIYDDFCVKILKKYSISEVNVIQ